MGHLVNKNGVMSRIEIINATRNLKTPNNGTDVQWLLGLTGVLRKFLGPFRTNESDKLKGAI